jgi:hypothetical protein
VDIHRVSISNIINQKEYYMIVLLNKVTGKEVELTENDLDALYSALGDYQDYGDEEAELSESIRDKLYSV